ncbi:hypothetical protein PIB30_097510, partial [Stylosanthes scabra]|nr:hypothetical protein [Stylosanthes scabra]
HGHDTEECRDLLDFIEEGLKNRRFREYTGRNRNKDDERRVRQRQNSPKTKAERRRDEPKERSAHREIAMISGGIPDEGNPPSKKAAKRSKHSCLAVEVMPRPLAGNPPPAIVFSSEEIRQTTSNMNQPLKVTWKHTPMTYSDFPGRGSHRTVSSPFGSPSETPRTQEMSKSDG